MEIITIILRTTYFNQGFINIPIAFQHLIGLNNEHIQIICDGNPNVINHHINRTANRNNTPRIYGPSLNQWFQENFHINDQLIIEIHNPNTIKILLNNN